MNSTTTPSVRLAVHALMRAVARAQGLRRLALLPLAALTVPAFAQQAAAPAAAGGGLEEIVVTAQKREQNPQEVGIAISAVTSNDLQQLGVTAASDIARTMPAVVLTQPNGPSSFSLSIRGVTQNDFADHQESPAAVYIDEVYVSQMAGLAFTMFDMDRVEVLRGPQGTLFGRNATGGLANFVTRRPTDDFQAYTNISYGQRNYTHLEGAVSGRIRDGIDGRLSVQSNHYDPLFKNTYYGGANAENGNDWGVRAQLLFKDLLPGQLLFIWRTGREDVHAGSWEEYATKPDPAGANTLLGPNENAYGTCNGCNASGLPNSGPFQIRDNISGFARIKTTGITGRYSQDLGFATFNAIADYSTLVKDYQEDSDASPYTIFQFFNGSDVKQESLELRLNGGDKLFNWTAGLYGLRVAGNYYEGWQGPAFFLAQEYDSPANPNAGYSQTIFGSNAAWPYAQPPGGAGFFYQGASPDPNGNSPATIAPYSQLTKSYAAFGQIEYRLSDLIGFTFGGRVTRDQKDYNFTWFPFLYNNSSPSGGAITVLHRPVLGRPLDQQLYNPYVASRSDNLWSGKAQVDFHLSQDALAYVSFNRGVKGGGYTAPLFPATINDLSTLTFAPEKLNSYEVGFKSEWLNHTLRANGAVYYYDYKDYQALIYTLGLEQLVRNADARHEGAELEIEWAPNEYWRFGIGGAYTDAIVKNVPGRVRNDNFQLVKGDFIPPNAPRWTGNAMARYTLPFAGGHAALQVDGNYLTKFYFNLADDQAVEQGAYGVLNARVSFVPASEKLEVAASVDNIANRHYALMGFDNTSINGLAQRYPGMPRWWKLHLNYKF